MKEKPMYSTTEAAHILRLSRIEVFRKIKAGKIKAEKVGRNYIIPHESIIQALGKIIGSHKKEEIEKSVTRAIKEYKDVFERLGKE